MDGYKIKTKGFLKHVKNSGGIITIIAKRMGVDRTSLIAWLNKNPSFWEYVYNERENIVDIAESKLIGKLNDDQDWAIKFILGSTNRGMQRGYSYRPEVQIIGKQSNVQINVEANIHEILEKARERWNLLSKTEN